MDRGRVLGWEELKLLGRAILRPADPDDTHGLDPELMRRLGPAFERLIGGYFRMEVQGLERVPPGAALIVGNHNSGVSFIEPFAMAARWYRERGGEPLYTLAHDLAMSLPLLGSLLNHVGAVRASHRNARALLSQGHKVLVFPGGELEAFRPFSERNCIRFFGRKGFVRLALRARVPIVPLVTVGGQEGFFVLTDGQWIARFLHLDRLLRFSSFAIYLGLPFGIGFGPTFHLPLPTKVVFRFLEPIPVDGYPADAAQNPLLLQYLYDLVTGRMQQAMDEIAAARRFPVIG